MGRKYPSIIFILRLKERKRLKKIRKTSKKAQENVKMYHRETCISSNVTALLNGKYLV